MSTRSATTPSLRPRSQFTAQTNAPWKTHDHAATREKTLTGAALLGGGFFFLIFVIINL